MRCEIESIVVEVTESCNHACLHCYNYWRSGESTARPAPPQLSRAEVRRLVRKVRRDAPLRQVALSGGEPLLRRDLPEIVCDLTLEGLNPVVITNGALLTDDRLDRFPEGSIFEVTLFSADADLHDRIAGRPAFAHILEGLVRLRKHHCRFVLACVVTRLNAADTLRTIELGIALGADSVMLNRLNLSRSMLPLAHQLVPTAADLRASLDAAAEAVERYGVNVAVSVPVPPCVVDPLHYPSLHFGWCPRGSKEAYYTISSNGELRPCNHSSFVLGDLRTESFADLVQSREAREFWAPVPQKCLECEHPLKDLCRGGCPAAARECYGTALREDPFIELADAAPPPIRTRIQRVGSSSPPRSRNRSAPSLPG